MSALAIGLLGSGEFEPWAAEIDRALLRRATTGDGRVLVLPTASAPEGDNVFEGWGQRGVDHYARLGIRAEIVPLRTREDADDPSFSQRLEQASLVFFSGGNPAYLAKTLAGTLFWANVLEAMTERGLAFAGCSAGAIFLGPQALDSTVEELTAAMWHPGLGFFPSTHIGPHWDALDTFVPGLRDFFVASVPSADRLLCLDEFTGVWGDGHEWTVTGTGAAHIYDGETWEKHPSGTTFRMELR